MYACLENQEYAHILTRQKYPNPLIIYEAEKIEYKKTSIKLSWTQRC